MMAAINSIELEDTQENTQNHTQKSQEVESQPVAEKDPWARLFKKRILRKRLGTTAAKTVGNYGMEYFGMCTHFFVYFLVFINLFADIRGTQFCFGRDPKACHYVCGKDEGLDLKTWNRISKIHFMLYREGTDPSSPVLLRDVSRNGTYINGELVGQNEVRLIKSTDYISIIEPHVKSESLLNIFLDCF